MVNRDISRRDFLVGAGAAGLGAVTVGTTAAAAEEPDGHVIGTSTRAATEAAKRQAESIRHVLDFGDIGQAVAGQYSEEALDDLERNPNVRYIEPESRYEAIGQSLPWGIDRLDAEVAHSADSDGDGSNETGDGAHIAIIDTGIDDDHPDIDGNIADPSVATNHTAKIDCGVRFPGPPCSHADNCNYDWSDDHDHGTHVAGIADAEDNVAGVVGVSTQATLHSVKVLDCNGSGTTSDVAAGITWVGDRLNGDWSNAVANMSLGGPDDSAIKDAVQYAENQGVLLVAAAGNDGPCTDCVGYPAAYSEVIAVSATNQDDCLASFSSQGPEVELAAPGDGIESTVIGGYGTFSGTSMASPHVAGTGGQRLANGDTATEARDQLAASAEDIGLSSNEQGNGLVDTAAALGLDSSDSSGSCGGDSGSGGDNPPSVDSLDMAEDNSGGSPHADFDASWTVSDSDGDLDTVELTLSDNEDGETEDTTTVDVSGDKASGTSTLTAKHEENSGHEYAVELIVTDASGNTGSDTAIEVEDGS